MSEHETEVLHLYQQWVRAWQTFDPELMLTLYDLESDGLVYQAEENSGPIYTAAQLRSYWAAVPQLVEAIPLWKEKSRKVVAAPGHAFIYAHLDTKIVSPAFGGEVAGEMRVTMGCRKQDNKWRINQYHESRQLEIAAAAGVKIIGS